MPDLTKKPSDLPFYLVDAFASEPFAGNPAGVVLLGGRNFPPEAWMQKLAAEVRCSETAYVRARPGGGFALRYFTPTEEIPLCGHATVAAFTVLREETHLSAGVHAVETRAGEIAVTVEPELVWMELAPPRELAPLDAGTAQHLYRIFGFENCSWTGQPIPPGLEPVIADAGVTEVLLPVPDREALAAAAPDMERLAWLSQKLDVVGAHLFAPGGGADTAAYCRNFAPAWGIPEEAATGTSNGALTGYLWRRGLVRAGAVNRFVQGEAMGRPSDIWSRLTEADGAARVEVGGRACLLVRGTVCLAEAARLG